MRLNDLGAALEMEGGKGGVRKQKMRRREHERPGQQALVLNLASGIS